MDIFESLLEALNQLLGIIIAFAVLFICFIFPIILTVKNIIHLVKKDVLEKKKQKCTVITMITGILLSAFDIALISSYKWDEPVVINEPSELTRLHEPFSSDYALSLFLFALAAVVCLVILSRGKILPPLAAAMCVSGVYGGIILSLFFISQLSVNLLDFDDVYFLAIPYLILFCVNYIIIAARVIRETILLYTAHFRENDIEPKNAIDKHLRKILEKFAGWIWFPILGIIPITGLLMIICILFGQGPFGIIKAFTETSDWAYSTMISPPPVEYEGHYLCTVAVNGHEKVVKPTRLGIRHGVKIGVNRQLCVANAFEQLIEDKAPRFHKWVRHVYDKYGYPLSKHITTKLRADLVYIAMKPLEWLFLLTLYLLDRDPESRIAVQYTGRHIREFMNI
ncbi:MAG: hypothetical protein PUI48_02015 [Oscillospiraceae bacterium]|nr:hypothetical protein [Oscillospiraceae bacterium]MDY6209419.1 DUF6688 family protein [Oscillospiraceae bacterium]